MRRPALRAGMVYLLCALVVAAAFATGALDRGKTWTNLHVNGMNMREGKTAFSAAEGDDYGMLNYGPYLNLAPGDYTLKWHIFADGDNQIRLISDNNALVEPNVIPLKADEPLGETTFTVRETTSRLSIAVDFLSGTYIELHDVRVYTPGYNDGAWLLAFFAAAMCLGHALWRRGVFTQERRRRLLLVAVAVVMVSAPLFKENLLRGHDTDFHIARLCNLADGLRAGQFPVRHGGFSFNGYGAVTSVFYPDIFLYPSALMMLGGASLQLAYSVYVFAMNALAAASMTACAKRVFRDADIAACAAILYVCSMYRLADAYTRSALGELTAMTLMPVFFMGLYEVVLGEKRRWPLLTLGAVGVYLSHMISTLLCACMAAGVCLIFAQRVFRERRYVAILKALGLTVLLCAFHLIPFLLYSAQGIGAASIALTPDLHAIAPAQLLLTNMGHSAEKPADWQLCDYVGIGFPLILGMVMALYVASKRPSGEWDRPTRGVMLMVGASAALSLMTTTLFPWARLSRLSGGLVDYLQFPWRLMMFVSLLLALGGAFGFMRFAGERREAMLVAVLALSVVCVLPMLRDETLRDDYVEYGQTANPFLRYSEYTLPGTDVAATLDTSVRTDGELTLDGYVKDGARVSAHVEAATDARLELPVFAFDGYAARVDGERMQTELGENNRLAVLLPAGTSGELRVEFEGKRIWLVGDGISAVAAAGALMGWYRGRKRRHG